MDRAVTIGIKAFKLRSITPSEPAVSAKSDAFVVLANVARTAAIVIKDDANVVMAFQTVPEPLRLPSSSIGLV